MYAKLDQHSVDTVQGAEQFGITHNVADDASLMPDAVLCVITGLYRFG
jgi:hypothetical protein